MTTTSKSRARYSSSPSTSNAAAGLSFSIEKILGKSTPDKEYVARPDDSSKDCATISVPERAVKYPPASPLPWLAYTRYCPPKIPRSRKRQKHCKRKSSGNPRVPFSTNQLLRLEKKYSQGRYLSASEVVKISEDLDLAQHRIKIWFQNRRAREKRTENEN